MLLLHHNYLLEFYVFIRSPWLLHQQMIVSECLLNGLCCNNSISGHVFSGRLISQPLATSCSDNLLLSWSHCAFSKLPTFALCFCTLLAKWASSCGWALSYSFLAFITAQGSFHCTKTFAENKSLREGRGRIKPLKGGFLENVLTSKSFKPIVNLRRLDRHSENHRCDLGTAKNSFVDEARVKELMESG